MKCHHCGFENENDWKYCHHCGRKLSTEIEEENPLPLLEQEEEDKEDYSEFTQELNVTVYVKKRMTRLILVGKGIKEQILPSRSRKIMKFALCLILMIPFFFFLKSNIFTELKLTIDDVGYVNDTYWIPVNTSVSYELSGRAWISVDNGKISIDHSSSSFTIDAPGKYIITVSNFFHSVKYQVIVYQFDSVYVQTEYLPLGECTSYLAMCYYQVNNERVYFNLAEEFPGAVNVTVDDSDKISVNQEEHTLTATKVGGAKVTIDVNISGVLESKSFYVDILKVNKEYGIFEGSPKILPDDDETTIGYHFVNNSIYYVYQYYLTSTQACVVQWDSDIKQTVYKGAGNSTDNSCKYNFKVDSSYIPNEFREIWTFVFCTYKEGAQLPKEGDLGGYCKIEQ